MKMPSEAEGTLTIAGRDYILTIPIDTSTLGSQVTVTMKPMSGWRIRPRDYIYDDEFYEVKKMLVEYIAAGGTQNGDEHGNGSKDGAGHGRAGRDAHRDSTGAE